MKDYLCKRQKLPELARAVHLKVNDYFRAKTLLVKCGNGTRPFNVSDYLKSGVKICPTPITW